MSEFNTISYMVLDIWHQLAEHLSFFAWLVPLILLYEAPLMLLVLTGIMRFYYTNFVQVPRQSLYKPKVSCVITCYAEGEAVKSTIDSFIEQVYDGEIEIIAVVDGAVQFAGMTIGAHGLDVELAASLHHQIAAPAFADIGAW